MRRLSTFTEHVEWIGARQLRIPRFQRDVVWDVERQRGFAEAYIGQRILTSPIVWWTPSERREHILLDGLQRLTALDVPMTRDDGVAQVRSSVALDVFTREVVDFADRPGAGLDDVTGYPWPRPMASLSPAYTVWIRNPPPAPYP